MATPLTKDPQLAHLIATDPVAAGLNAVSPELFEESQVAMKPTASIIMVSPEMAERWLSRNKVNRNLRNAKVAQYARDMAAGDWTITGEAIKFDREGKLIDGQHRCWAITESGCTVSMFVIRGLPPESQSVMDSGMGRTAGDNLSMQGFKYATTVAAIARRMKAYTEGGDPKAVTNSEVYAFVDSHPAITEAAAIGVRYARHCDLSPSTGGVAAWLIAEFHGWDVADQFFCAAAEKVGLAPADPVLAMTAFFAEQRRQRRRLDLHAELSVIIRCFNARWQGKSMKVVRIQSSAGGMVPIPKVAS